MIYLDYAANTPVEKDVLKNFLEVTTKYIANPNSSHKLGELARNEIDRCSMEIARYFDVDKDSVIYTSGASEANNLVIKGIALRNRKIGKHIIISALEHSSIVAPCNFLTNLGYEVSVLPITKEGVVDLEELEHIIRDDTILVSVCYVDSELGTIQPINEIAKIVHEYPDCIFHTDATQAVGKISVDFSNCDFVTFAPHKFYGINGVGVLLNTNDKKLVPLIHGGKSTTVYRSGTPVIANVTSTYKAIEIAYNNLEKRFDYVCKLNKKLRDELSCYSRIHINSTLNSIPNTFNFSLIEIDAKKVFTELSKNEIYLSTTSACSLGNSPSKSVLAITNDMDLAKNSIRISLSHLTKESEIDEFLKIFRTIYDKEIRSENN